MAVNRRHRAASAAALLTAAAVIALATAVVVGPPQAPWQLLSAAPGRPALVTLLTGLAGWGIAAALVTSAAGHALGAPLDRSPRGARTNLWATLICLCGVLILVVSVIQATAGYRVCCSTTSASERGATGAP